MAMFPEELPRRLIKMFSFVGETVFDPFLGSGTTSLAAMNLGRNSIGYENNLEYESVIREKIGGHDEDSEISFFCDNRNNMGFDFSRLPYMFSDPLKMDKQVDVKSLTFGSKISQNH